MSSSTKAWYESKAVWAGAVGAILAAYEVLKSTAGFPLDLPDIPSYVYAILSGLGIYGRVTATKTIEIR